MSRRAPSDMSEDQVTAWLREYPGIGLDEAHSLLLQPPDYESGGVRYWYCRTLMSWASLWNTSKRIMVDREAARLAVRGAALSSSQAVKTL
jgi:hypothetical protein